MRTRAKRKQARLTEGELERALQHVLTSTLALYVLKNSTKPVRLLLDDLVRMEARAVRIVGHVLQMLGGGAPGKELEGTLSAVCSFIPFPSQPPPPGPHKKKQGKNSGTTAAR